MAWYNESGKDDSIVISSRIRLARNLREFPFPNNMKDKDLAEVLKKCRSIYDNNKLLRDDFLWLEMENTPLLERKKLMEMHLISPEMVRYPKGRALMMSKDEKISIMFNEEDHIRIQVLFAGLELENGLKLADQVDDIFSEGLDIAFSPKLGYLTSCPTNIGTGIRASAMLHLPALLENGYIDQILAAISRMGIAVRGLYGEGSKAAGNLFQVSNQVTLGLSEKEIISRLKEIIQNIVAKEREVRKQVASTQSDFLIDRVWRAFAVMQHAYMISSDELLKLISDVRIGADLGIIEVDKKDLTQLLIETSPAHVADVCGNDKNPQLRDKKRAEIVRKLKVRGDKHDQ